MLKKHICTDDTPTPVDMFMPRADVLDIEDDHDEMDVIDHRPVHRDFKRGVLV